MNTKQQAATDLKRLSQMLKGVIAIGDDLETLGSIEQAEAEARSRIIKLQDDEEAIRLRLVDADATLQAATVSVESVKRKADERAAQMIADATVSADSAISFAKDRSAQIVDAAKQTANELDASLKDKRGLLRSLNADITAAQSRLDEVNAKLSELRKRL